MKKEFTNFIYFIKDTSTNWMFRNTFLENNIMQLEKNIMLKEFTNLAYFIKNNSINLKIIYVVNNGNWGDALIHRGTLEFFRYFGIKFFQFSRKDLVNKLKNLNPNEKSKFLSESLLISAGGGSWCRNFKGTYEFIEYYSNFFQKIIVMPHTYELPKIKHNKSNITYFARDKFLSKNTIPESIFCHDMAFFLKPTYFIDLFTKTFNQDGNFFRSDKEINSKQSLPDNNFDISSKGNELRNIFNFFRTISKYKVINTDRLHVAIASSLLNKKTNLYPGNYPKIESVYYSSIEPFFKSTTLKEW